MSFLDKVLGANDKLWLKRNNVITFDKNDKVMVIASTKNNGREYYLMGKLSHDEADITEYKVMEAFIEEQTLQNIIDIELLLELKPLFMKEIRSLNSSVKKDVNAFFVNIEKKESKNILYIILDDKKVDVIGYGINDVIVNRMPRETTQYFLSRAEKILYSDTGILLTEQYNCKNFVEVTIAEYLADTNTKYYEPLYHFAYKYPECLYYIKKAAEQGDAEAIYWSAKCHDDGHGVDESIEIAFQMMKEAAERGFPKAFVELGRMYDSKVYGGYCDHEKAVYWYKKALEHGFTECAGMLSLKYRYGLGVNEDLVEADRLEKMANGYRMK